MENKRRTIKESENVQQEWYDAAKNIDLQNLPGFISHLLEDYEHDYGTICHALAAGAIATMWAMNKHEQGGITGFQASAIMWEIVSKWSYESNKTGLRMLDYDNMLYPQYSHKFERTISPDVWKKLQEVAKNSLEINDVVHPNVKEHWESIVEGKVPFGYAVVED